MLRTQAQENSGSVAIYQQLYFFFFSSRRRHTRCGRDWSSDVCSSDLKPAQFVRTNRVSSNIWRLWLEMRPYSGHLAVLFLVSLLGAPLALLVPLPLKIAVDNVIGSRPLPHFLTALLPSSVKGSAHSLLF